MFMPAACIFWVSFEISMAQSLPPRYQVDFRYSPAAGLGAQKNVCRRDPSDIIRVEDHYYIWYTRVEKDRTVPGDHGYPSGYQGSVWYAVSVNEGRNWTEIGEAIPKGAAGQFDCTATFTPNILVFEGRYYLYYTAVGPAFDNGPYADKNRTSIGVASSDRPDGPWKKMSDLPVLESTDSPQRFDSYRVDDACLVVRDSRIWMYYKGRQWNNTPSNTKMGVAVAEKAEGPFERLNEGVYVQDSGHEVLIWPIDSGIMSLVSNSGPNRLTLQYAPDGLDFRVVGPLPPDYPKAPGMYRPDLTGDAGVTARWGICMATYQGDPYLERFEVILSPQGGQP